MTITTTTADLLPLVDWLNKVHERQSARPTSTHALRVRAERARLERHVVLWDGTCAACWYTTIPANWPCREWRLTAAGWAHLPGYRADWLPGELRR